MKKNYDELCIGDRVRVEVGEEGNWITGFICSICVTHATKCVIDMIYESEGEIRHIEFCSPCSEMVLDYLGHDKEWLESEIEE